MPKTSQIIALILVLVIGLGAGYGIGYYTAPKPTPLTNIVFTTAWTVSGSNSWILLGQAKGFFEEEGIALTVVRGYGGADTVAKIVTGTFDAGFGDIPTLIKAKSEDSTVDVIAIELWHGTPGPSITVLSTSSINAPRDLRGKTMVSTAFDASRLFWPVFAEKAGVIDEGEDPLEVVSWTVVDSTLRTPMLLESQTDAVAGYWMSVQRETLALDHSLTEIRQFMYSDYFPFLGDALLVRKSLVDENPNIGRGLARACARSMIYAWNHPDEATTELLRREPLLNKDAELSYLKTVLGSFLTEEALEKGLSYQDDAFINEVIDVVVEGLDLERRPEISEVYTREYLPPVSELKP